MASQKETVHFKQIIDEQLIRVAEYAGSNAQELTNLLVKIKLKKNEGPWYYLIRVCREVKAFLNSEKLHDKITNTWIRYILEDDQKVIPYFVGILDSNGNDVGQDSIGEGLLGTDVNTAIYSINYFPNESHQALKEGTIVAGYGTDLLVLWPNGDRSSRICFVSPESFEILGNTIPEFLKNQLDKCLN